MAAPLDIVRQLVATINHGDIEAFLAFFPEDGIVTDWGRAFVGHDAIRAWSDEELIGAQGHMTIKQEAVVGNVVTLETAWKSNYFSSDSGQIIFEVAGNQVKSLTIPEVEA
jgi:hypothetical protein